MNKKVIARKWMYLHGSKSYANDIMEDMADDGIFDSMTEKEFVKFQENFMYALYEIGIDLEIYKDGTYKILGVKQ